MYFFATTQKRYIFLEERLWDLLFCERLPLPFLYLTLALTTFTPPPFSNPVPLPNIRVLWGNDFFDSDSDFGGGFGVPG